VTSSLVRLARQARLGGCQWRRVVLFVVAFALTSPWLGHDVADAQPAPEQKATDAGTAFEPAPLSRVEFGVKPPPPECTPQRSSSIPPAQECDGQKRFVSSGDGTQIYVETTLPSRLEGGPAVPERLPTILIMTPYATFDRGLRTERHQFWPTYFASRGYAVSIGHVPGTGNSDGCIDVWGGPREVDATAHVIDFLGTAAPWTNGKVGMVGLSSDATTQIGAATLGDPKLTAPLKAIVPVAPTTSAYDFVAFDGVPTGTATSSAGAYAGISLLPGDAPAPLQPTTRPSCTRSSVEAAVSVDTAGNSSPFMYDREYRRGAANVRAAVLFAQGLADTTAYPTNLAGFFDRLPAELPKKLILGQWGHGWPDRHAPIHELPHNPQERLDWPSMVQAWMDHFLMGLPTGVGEWPDVQVQEPTGQWRAAPGWPSMGGMFGQLALGNDGVLGGSTPEGSTSYSELASPGADSQVSFATSQLQRDLRITGQPVLDLWVSLSNPDGIGDAHVAAKLEAFGPPSEEAPDGAPLVHAPIYGARSLQHLDPMPNGYFEQSEAKPAPLQQALSVALRFTPTDLVVPAGGHLKLTIGSPNPIDWPYTPLVPSGARTQVEVLHSCDYPSVLRFALPSPDANLINVREQHEESYAEGSLPSHRRDGSLSVDGGGLASKDVCGTGPVDPQQVALGKIRSGITYLGPTVAQTTDEVVVRAALVDRAGGPLVNREIEFTFDDEIVGRSLTDEQGNAQLSVLLDGPARLTQIAATFAGDDATMQSSTTVPFEVALEDASLAISAEREHGRTSLTAQLTESDTTAPLSGLTITFLHNGASIGTAVADDDGIAVVTVKKKIRSGDTMSAIFAGSDTYGATRADLTSPP
jgi:predicted acyl esterase